MGFGDLKSDSGLTALNTWLTDKSYITGYEPSQNDAAVFVEIDSPADAIKYPNVVRWHKHIATYDTSKFPGDAQVDVLTLGPETVAEALAADEDEDDVDLFGSDDEEVDEEAERVKAQRLAEYNAKKAKKPKTVAKSIVTLEVKPWDDETNLEELLANVKDIEMDGLVWGASQWIPVGYGIKKLQINLVIEDEKVSLSDLQELIEEDEDHVQSTDVAAMQKL